MNWTAAAFILIGQEPSCLIPCAACGTAVDYPCLCLCLGFSQITLIRPFLLMILHFSQIGFTDDLTFMLNLLSKKTVLHYNMVYLQMQDKRKYILLFVSPNNSALAQVIG